MSLTAGRSLSHYRLIEPIGEGGMGVVWKANDGTLGRDVAIKVLPDEIAASLIIQGLEALEGGVQSRLARKCYPDIMPSLCRSSADN